jgi:hypothetical protein
VQAGEGFPSNGRQCPLCGLTLPPSDLPAHPNNAMPEPVLVKPYYALEEPQIIGYRVVEVTDSEENRSPAQPSSSYPFEKPPPNPRWPETDSDEINYLRAKARHDRSQEQRGRPEPWPLETNGWQCLLYPLQVIGQILSLAFFLTVTMLLLGTTSSESDVPVLLFFVLVVQAGVTWNFLRQVLRLAAAGQTIQRPVAVLFRAPGTTARCALMAGAAFLAGPVFLLAGAIWFWVHAGALEWLDYLLLGNLWLATGVSWVYLLLAVDDRGRLRDAHAKAVVRLCRRQGWPALVFPPVAGASLTIFAYLSVAVWFQFFHMGFEAFLVQFLLWIAGLFFWTFLLRWYGMTGFWRRQRLLRPKKA